jgi:hypothetical protein
MKPKRRRGPNHKQLYWTARINFAFQKSPAKNLANNRPLGNSGAKPSQKLGPAKKNYQNALAAKGVFSPKF